MNQALSSPLMAVTHVSDAAHIGPLDLHIPSEVARDSGLTPAAKLLLGVVRALQVRDGYVDASDAELSTHVGLAARTVRGALEQLYYTEWVERLGTEKRRTGLVARSAPEQALRFAEKTSRLKTQALSAAYGHAAKSAAPTAKSAASPDTDAAKSAASHGKICRITRQNLPHLPPDAADFAASLMRAGAAVSNTTLTPLLQEREGERAKKNPELALPAPSPALPHPPVAPPPRSLSPGYDNPAFSSPGVHFPFPGAAFRAHWTIWREHLLSIAKPYRNHLEEEAGLRELARIARDPNQQPDEAYALAIIDRLISRGNWVQFEPISNYYPSTHSPSHARATTQRGPNGRSLDRPGGSRTGSKYNLGSGSAGGSTSSSTGSSTGSSRRFGGGLHRPTG